MSNKRHSKVVSKFSWLIATALAFCVQLPAHAQTSGPRTLLSLDWRERHAPNGELTAYDSTLLGDAIDLSSGRLSFEHVDVSLPGNFNLPVEMRRRLNPSQMQSGEFADWQLAVPTISTKILADEWFAGRRWGKVRCSGTLASAIPNASWPTRFSGASALPPSMYSDGVILDVPGRVQAQVLDKTVTSAWPASAKKVTANGWYLECLANIDGAGTEGFVAVAPNGDRYTFNVLMNPGSKKSDFDIWQLDANFPIVSAVHWIKMGVYYDVLSVSQVTDVNGNRVQYSYDANKQLQSITSSDGRRIDIGRTGSQVGTVTANPGTANARQWTYTYGWKNVTMFQPPSSVNGIAGSQTQSWGTLTAVTLPNGRQWQFDLGGLQARSVPGTSYSGTTCKQFNQTVSLTHPDGVTGTFTIEEVLLRLGMFQTGSTGPYCPNSSLGSMGSAALTNVMAVTHKTLTSPSTPTATWDYSYYDAISETQVTIQQPDGSKRAVYHPTPYDSGGSPRGHAKPTKEALYPTSASNTPIEVKTYSYVQEPAAGSNFVQYPVGDTYAPVRLSDTVITRGSDIYNTHAVFNTDRTSTSYSYGFPTSVQQWSNLSGGTRQTDTVYAHNTSLWILGLPATITKNSKLFDSFTYDAFGRLWKHYRFGDLWRTYSYHTVAGAIGAPYSMTDGLATPRTTYFRNWKGGTPQEVERADGYKLYRTVDSNGWVTSITDWNGSTTNYTYDNQVGRLTGITPPATWNGATISYSYPNGTLQKVRTQAAPYSNLRITTTYDAMLRPKQVQNESLTGYGGNIFVNYTYDAMGRKTFASLPSTTAGSTTGIQTSYDALGRVTQTVENASGGGTTNIAYLAGNKTRVTDPLNYQTTNTASAFGDPGDGNLIKTEKPEGVTIDFGYDIYGKQTSIAQLKDDGSQLVSTFEYDYRLLVCREKVAETGNTLYFYNSDYELTNFSEGQPSGTGCASPPFPSQVTLGYDLAGRLLTTDYPGSTPDIARTYDPNGNLLTVIRGSANWTYTYNAIDLVESERLDIDGRSYVTDPSYDLNGYLTSKMFPSGRAYTYTDDGHGRPKDISYPGTTYLSGAIYHPNSQISTLYRGIGGTYYRQLNPRQLVSSIGGNWGTSLNYDYDAMGRVKLIDSPNNNYDRTLITYDGVGRLKTANGPWGTGTYGYDRLGNTKQKTEGSRTVDITYDSTNRVSSVRDTAVSSNWRSYSHDTRGNVTADGLHTFTYDYANQPIAVTGGDIGIFAYDGNLKRVKQVIDGKTVYSIYDKSGSLLTRDDVTASQVTDYISLGGQTFVRVTNGTPSYPLNDHLGSAYMVADQNGNVSAANTFNFTPFGETVGIDPGNNNQQGFTGHIEDETGLTYMQARYYDPVIGRFLAADPIGYGDDWNLYAYVGNDPANNTDPSGTGDCPNGANGCPTQLPDVVVTGKKAPPPAPAGITIVVEPMPPLALPRATTSLGWGTIVGWLGNALFGESCGDSGKIGPCAKKAENAVLATQKPSDKSRRSKPTNAPSGTKPIDQGGKTHDWIEGTKGDVGAGPADWVGIAPNGDIITTNPDGTAENHGPSDR